MTTLPATAVVMVYGIAWNVVWRVWNVWKHKNSASNVLVWSYFNQVTAAATGRIDSFYYWETSLDLDGYTKVGEGDFTVDSYCEQALMDRQGSLQLNR